MYYIRIKEDRHARRWKVREAVSINAACRAVTAACASGSIGWKDLQTDVDLGRPVTEWPTRVLAEVVQVNSDNTERQAYTEAY